MNDVERFLCKTVKLDGGCVQWLASKDKQGYGYFSLGKLMHAHRASYMLFKGPIPEGMLVMHECDNPSCVNPNHISLGTHAQNQAQKFQRKLLLGECRKVTKLTDDQVLAIYADSRPQSTIAKDFDVFQGTVAAIKLGQRWSNLTGHKKEKPGHFKGTSSYQAKLTAEQVRAIRSSTKTTKELCEEYGVSQASMYKVINRKSYRDI